MNILSEVTQNQFVLVLLNESQYRKQLNDIAKSVEKSKNKICYVCLSRPYKDVLSDLKENNINTKLFFFVDVLSSHYEKIKSQSNCEFINSPNNMKAIKQAIENVIKKEKCSVLLFDTISALLIYQESFSILQFTHNITTKSKNECVKKIFIALKKDSVPERESKELVSDLRMFADKTIDLD